MRRYRKVPIASIAILIVLIIYAISLIVPLIWSFITSFKGKLDYMENPFGFPKEWRFNNFIVAIENYKSSISTGGKYRTVYIEEMLLNSVIYAVGCSFVGTFVTCIMAYVASRFNFIISRIIYVVVVVTMILPIVGSLPSEIQVLRTLGLYDNMLGMFVLSSSFLGMHFLIFYGMFKGYPKDFSEAAYVDGGGEFTVLFKIMIPLARSTFMTIMLLKFVGYWNDYNMTMSYMPNIKTLAFGLYEYSRSYSSAITGTPMKLAGCSILVIPVFIVFICFHDRIMGNISTGGIKE